MKTTHKGDLGTILVIEDLLQRGLQVALPFSSDCKYDLILDKEGALFRVQVKASTPKKGVLTVKCQSSSSWGAKTHNIHKYTSADIDLLAAVDLNSKKVYYIPATVLGVGVGRMALRLEPTGNNQVSGINWASSYTDP